MKKWFVIDKYSKVSVLIKKLLYYVDSTYQQTINIFLKIHIVFIISHNSQILFILTTLEKKSDQDGDFGNKCGIITQVKYITALAIYAASQ